MCLSHIEEDLRFTQSDLYRTLVITLQLDDLAHSSRLAKRSGRFGVRGIVPHCRAAKNANITDRPHRLAKGYLPPQPGALSPLAPVPGQALGQVGFRLREITHLCPARIDARVVVHLALF